VPPFRRNGLRLWMVVSSEVSRESGVRPASYGSGQPPGSVSPACSAEQSVPVP